MKNIKYIMSLVVLAIIFFACTDDYDRSTGGAITAKSPVLNMLSQNEFLIEKPADAEEGNFLFRASWAAPRFSFQNGMPVEVSNLKYLFQAGILGNEFEETATVSESDLLFTDIYSARLYSVAEELAGENFEGNVNMEFRILATYDGITETLVSNSITVVVLQKEIVEPVEPVEFTIRFKQTTGSWEEFAVYAWGESEVYGGWPGQTLEADADGWYSFTVPVNRPINIIINNNGGGNQVDFLSDPEMGACYEFDTENSTWTAVDCPVSPIIIRWKYIGTEWATTAIYAWGGDPAGDTFGGWPGTVGTPDADGWCSVTVPVGQTVGNIIFNNETGGDGGQFDVTMAVTENTCFEITSSSFTVVDCE